MFKAEKESGVHGVNNNASRWGRRLRKPQKEVTAPGIRSPKPRAPFLLAGQSRAVTLPCRSSSGAGAGLTYGRGGGRLAGGPAPEARRPTCSAPKPSARAARAGLPGPGGRSAPTEASVQALVACQRAGRSQHVSRVPCFGFSRPLPALSGWPRCFLFCPGSRAQGPGPTGHPQQGRLPALGLRPGPLHWEVGRCRDPDKPSCDSQ